MASITLDNLVAIVLDHIEDNTIHGGGGSSPTPVIPEDIKEFLANWDSWSMAMYKLLKEDTIYSKYIEGKTITVDNAIAQYLNVVNAVFKDVKITNLETNIATIVEADVQRLTADFIKASEVQANYVKTTDIAADTAELHNVVSTMINFCNAYGITLSTQSVNSFKITSDNVTFNNACITDAAIANVNAGKINAGTINTDNVTIASNSGNLNMTGETITLSDGSIVRVKLGKTSDGKDYSLTLWNASGTCIWDAQGIKRDAIADSTIQGKHIEDGAIDKSKLAWTSVLQELVNDGVLTKTTQIEVDGVKQTISAWLTAQQTTNKSFGEDVISLQAQITAAVDSIKTKVEATEFTKLSNGVEAMKTDVTNVQQKANSIEATVTAQASTLENLTQTVDGMSTTVSGHTTSITNISATADQLSTKVTSVEESTAKVVGDIDTISKKLEDSTFVAEDVLEQTISEYASQVTQKADAITINVEKTMTDKLGDTYVKKEFLDKFFDFTADGLIIGDTSSTVKLKIDNSAIQFYSVDQATGTQTELGYWDGNYFHARNMKIDVGEFTQFGDFKWEPRADGSLTLKKVQ